MDGFNDQDIDNDANPGEAPVEIGIVKGPHALV